MGLPASVSCLQAGNTAQWRHRTSLSCSQRPLKRGSQCSFPKMLDFDVNGTGRDSIPRATPYNTVIKKPTGHRAPGREQSRGQWPQEKRERKALGAGLPGLLRCGSRHRSNTSRGRSAEESAADPPPGRPALLPSSSGLARRAPLGLSRPPRQRRADTQSPSSPWFSPLPLTRALLVSNLVSILQAWGSEAPTRAPPLPAALRLPPRQRRSAAPPGSSPATNFRSQEPRTTETAPVLA